jgi:hypothetical protein
MRHAPAVSVRGTGGAVWRGVRVTLPAAAAGVFSAWVLLHLQSALVGWAAALAAALVVVWAWHATRATAQVLSWDGQVWRWGTEGPAGRVDVMMDLGVWVLLRFNQTAPAPVQRWLAVAEHEAGVAWHALRAALYARQPRAVEPAPGQGG